MATTRSQSPAAGLMVSRDLFFSSKVTGTAAQWGLSVELEGDVSQAIAKLAGHSYRCLILDLGTPGLSVSEMMATLPVENRPRVIAFDAHVRIAHLDAARAAGCDEVLPRSRFSAELPGILKRALDV